LSEAAVSWSCLNGGNGSEVADKESTQVVQRYKLAFNNMTLADKTLML